MPRHIVLCVEEAAKRRLRVAARLIRRKYRRTGSRPACIYLLQEAKKMQKLIRAGDYNKALHVANLRMMG
ncbi:MAG: hypothetical protein WEA04_02620 [Candidatus Andersenbacteria bacterium]